MTNGANGTSGTTGTAGTSGGGGAHGAIPKARLGANGPEVGVQGLGCMGMSFAYGPSDAAESRATLERALELGVTLYDTAHAYGAGENERFLSPFFKAHRDEVVVATKFGLAVDPDNPAGRIIRNDAAHIREAVLKAGGDPGRAIMVGDSITDLDAARATGVPCILTTFGYTDIPAGELGADLLIDHFDSLPAAIDALVAGQARPEL